MLNQMIVFRAAITQTGEMELPSRVSPGSTYVPRLPASRGFPARAVAVSVVAVVALAVGFGFTAGSII